MSVFGTEREWPARLPSVAAAVVIALAVADLAARRLGAAAGLVAGLAQASSVYVLVSGQLADPDMLLAAAVTLGYWCFGLAMLDGGGRASRALAVGFWASAGVSFLVKGPIGGVLLVPPVALWAVIERRRDALRFFFEPSGLALCAVLVAAWPLAAYLSYPGILDAWRSENLARFRGELGRSSPFFYLYTAPWMALPWTPFAALGAFSAWKERRQEALWTLLFLWLLAGVAVLSASAGKHDRYLAPVLPPLAVFAARGLLDFAPRVARRIRPGAALAVVLGVEWVVAVAVQRTVAARFDAYRPHRELAERVNRELPPDAELLLVGVPNNVRTQILFYLRRPVRLVDEASAAAPSLPSGRAAWMLAPAADQAALERLGRVEITDRSAKLLSHQDEGERLTVFRVSRG
jgi:4-amino-4-deoxy-L-arabinose transferase-like glycosyltransferase